MTGIYGRTSLGTNHRLLIGCLVVFAILGTTYYTVDDRKEVRQTGGMIVIFSWYAALASATAMVLKKTRSGYLMAGILSWTTLAFWLMDNWNTVFHMPLIAPAPNLPMTIRNFVGSAIAALAVLSSHNSFHKASKNTGSLSA